MTLAANIRAAPCTATPFMEGRELVLDAIALTGLLLKKWRRIVRHALLGLTEPRSTRMESDRINRHITGVVKEVLKLNDKSLKQLALASGGIRARTTSRPACGGPRCDGVEKHSDAFTRVAARDLLT